MNTLTQSDKIISMQRQLAGVLTQHLQLPIGVLGSTFIDIPNDPVYQDSTVRWWNSLSPRARYPLSLLKTLAAPTAVVDFRAMLGQRTLIQSTALAESSDLNAPWFLVGYNVPKDELQIRTLDTRQDLINKIRSWLETDSISFVPEMKFEVSLNEFCVLLSLLDLYTRSFHSACLTHSAVPESYAIDLIVRTYQESVQVSDPRWLLPFCLPLMPKDTRCIEIETVQQCVSCLTKKGLLQQDSSTTEVAFTTPGIFLAESLHRRSSLVGINMIGADRAGRIGSHTGLFVRSDESIWYCDIGADQKITVLALGTETTREILEALLTPVGIPPLNTTSETPQSITPPVFISPPLIPSKKENVAHQTTPPTCIKCGHPLTKASAKFCGFCGAPTQRDSPPRTDILN